jgi:hypothetical protein
MSYPRVVYHKDYPFGAIDHEDQAEKKRERLTRLAKSEAHLDSFGKDWFSVDEHPGRLEYIKQSQVEKAAEEAPYVEEEESKAVLGKKKKK